MILNLFVVLCIVVLVAVAVVRFVERYAESTSDEDVLEDDAQSIQAEHEPKSDRDLKLSYVHAPKSMKKNLRNRLFYPNHERAEDHITNCLCDLGTNYIIFTNVIFDKPGVVKTTEIDHLVVSPYGLFCVETKSHVGSIYGGAGSKEWKQYLAGTAYPIYSPLFQSRNHGKALGQLLGSKQKSMIHTYVVFPYASVVKVNSDDVFQSGYDLVDVISAHKNIIYNRQEMSAIAYTIASYTSRYEKMRDVHVDNVSKYVDSLR